MNLKKIVVLDNGYTMTTSIDFHRLTSTESMVEISETLVNNEGKDVIEHRGFFSNTVIDLLQNHFKNT